LCGGVRYQYEGEIEEISICHCSQCRKAQGAPFATVSPVETAKFRLLAGAGLLKEYHSSPDKVRVFCSHCGSPIYSSLDQRPELKRLRLGTVDTPFVCNNVFHIFTDSQASWYDCDDGHPRYAQRKP
jgi:hypothetical protein